MLTSFLEKDTLKDQVNTQMEAVPRARCGAGRDAPVLFRVYHLQYLHGFCSPGALQIPTLGILWRPHHLGMCVCISHLVVSNTL